MSEGYVSHFPGIDAVDSAKVFATSGYHEPQQKIPPVVMVIFVGAILSLIPILGSWISVLSLPAAFGMLQKRRLRDEQLPGTVHLRAALGLSVLGLGIGLASLIPMLMLSGTLEG